VECTWNYRPHEVLRADTVIFVIADLLDFAAG
jgi:hypothetical protein